MVSPRYSLLLAGGPGSPAAAPGLTRPGAPRKPLCAVVHVSWSRPARAVLLPGQGRTGLPTAAVARCSVRRATAAARRPRGTGGPLTFCIPSKKHPANYRCTDTCASLGEPELTWAACSADLRSPKSKNLLNFNFLPFFPVWCVPDILDQTVRSRPRTLAWRCCCGRTRGLRVPLEKAFPSQHTAAGTGCWAQIQRCSGY